ncbi:Stk1 family PASTA domain-containing Ser/Thr kinase [Romboutsia maritimum]|uniref:non-specific serine/threonine protein kinase n=1 Tax=Romboutsia maritimum TaxID=2020948 RepID=A0A371IWM3_9FIRM|nr:Stk1 family PASTA domain-containing Ser/Thr kinase [Romboutsia maritimum]RDY24875.1 Stk1 family PASTA domain-containing Ser/Thr kinase [Romboutsia maritimum]
MGDTILGNRYEIIKKIGDGGMAFVYEAKDKLLNRTVAVKVLRPEFVDDEEFLTKFKREAEAVASLSHPNIVNVYDVGEDGKVHYIVMELVEGQNLKEIIQTEGTLDEYTALDITKQIAMALSAAHKKGIIHRDIKPHNILISNEGRVVKVADFGIAKAVSNSTMTNIGSIIGSVHYFSPEQAKGKFVTNNADLYSLGIVLYEMLIGKVPFRGDSPISIALQHINDDIEFTSEEKVNIPQSVRTIIKKLTEKSSADRYQSAEELIEDIEYIEKNIDLDFIKEYDNYATKKIDQDDMNKSTSNEEDEYDEDDYDYEYEDDELMEEVPKKKKTKKPKKEDSPKTKKRLKIAVVILAIILLAQVFIAIKFIPWKSGTQTEAMVAPDLANMSLEDANKELEKLGLQIIVRDEYNARVPKDHVISQKPVAGSEVKKGDTVNIILSKGAKEAEVPNVVGLNLGEAENILKENKLELGNIKYQFSEIYKEGVVLSQSPTAGLGSIEEGEKISLVVSKGPEKTSIPSENNTQTITPEQNKNTDSKTNENTGHSIKPSKPSQSGNTGNGSNTTKPGNTGTGNVENNTEKPESTDNNQGNTGSGSQPGSGSAGENSGEVPVETNGEVTE